MFKNSYTYDDIGLVPTFFSSIESRDHVDPSTNFFDREISLPILTAPMSSVVDKNTQDAFGKIKGLCILPRGVSLTRPHIKSYSTKQVLDEYIVDQDAICIDTANGFNIITSNTIKRIRKSHPDIKIIAGNVGSVEGYLYLCDLGVDAVRVGVGNGQVCVTSEKTAIGSGQASLIREIAIAREQYGPNCATIIADGGIKGSADIVKAIALGADIVMAGRIFAGCEESPGQVIVHEGKKYKQYAGEASFAVKRSKKYVEGGEKLVPYSGKLEKTWYQLEDGIRSGMSYMNAMSIKDLKFLPDECFRLLSHSAKIERYMYA